jgi:hypothetical protein
MRSAIHTTVSVFGVIMGAAGIEHGIGEMLQGSAAPAGLMFPSWPNSAFFRIAAGEPAMSILPNLLVTGILATLFSLLFIVWAVTSVQRKNGGWILILLAVAMLLTGGGLFPPVLGIILGALGNAIHGLRTDPGVRRPAKRWYAAGRLWPGLFAGSVAAWLALFPGVNIPGYFFGVDDPNLMVALILLAMAFLAAAVVAGFARDFQQRAL